MYLKCLNLENYNSTQLKYPREFTHEFPREFLRDIFTFGNHFFIYISYNITSYYYFDLMFKVQKRER